MIAVEDAVEMNGQLLDQEVFHHLLLLERRRTERSRAPFVLMLLRVDGLLVDRAPSENLAQTLSDVLARCTRENDIRGWYEASAVIGVMFCESCGCDGQNVENLLFCRLREELKPFFKSVEAMNESLSFHFFPEEHKTLCAFSEPDAPLYPEITQNRTISKLECFFKRAIDLAGSLVLLVGLFPFFALIAALIKMSSPGPVFFRQERVGQFGKKFILLKFRTMINKCDTTSHENYMKDFIAGKIGECQPEAQDEQGDEKPVFKITNDSRVTPIGRFLRKTSLDELPQCFNVLMGEMSLVGPRPPIPYEVEIYDIWHRRRILEMKPGITGLWQVAGRSATTFDESVRLDLRYTKEWSLWLDLKILFMTPIVAITGKGGY